MALKFYNTLTRRKEEFVPLYEGRVGIYVCGPTVYDHAHIGHAKSYVSFDVIVRYLRYLGYRVRYVQNITDVGHLLDTGEDRILKGAARERIEPMELVERYTRSYFEDMDALTVVRPDISPRASGHIPEQIELVKTLIAKGYAYEVNGSVYFDVTKFPDYGKLSGRSLDEQEAGARVEVSPEKRHPADFALWKKADPAHIMRWPSPWGWGFPGWHLECSAMAMKYLGETIDIHGGGLENSFPHHECEIAQSEAATGKPFVRYWLHNNMVLVNGVKMSKSLGNFTTIKQALTRHSAEELRFFVLTSHYRSPLDYSDEAVSAAGQGLARLHTLLRTLEHRRGDAAEGEADAELAAALQRRKSEFLAAMDDDCNTAAAIGALFEAVHDVNVFLEAQPAPTRGSVDAALQFFKELAGDVLGITPFSKAGLSEKAQALIELLVEVRTQLRGAGDWQRADDIRARLKEMGVVLEDGRDKTTWRWA
ncbi:MAG: cysteine--tRNA ligase [candidate division KSB1 bacterium]|jgi:cysteinyl-tRNA synthetase|nr:cysteine--tRNA ligase [candidate division KSB1 bacterium]